MFNKTTPTGMPCASADVLRQQGVVPVGAGYESRDAPRGPGSHIMATLFQWTAHRHMPPHVD